MSKTVKISETTWRKINRALGDLTAQHTPSVSMSRSASIVRMRNDSGNSIAQFGVLGIAGPVFDPDTEPAAFKNQVVLSGIVPTTAAHASGKFAICCEPIGVGRVGSALVAGVSQAQVWVNDTAHWFADVADNQTDRLNSAASGPCSILWKAGGSGLRWAIVKHGGVGGQADSGTGKIEWVRIMNTTPHPMEGIIHAFNPATGTWSTTGKAVQLYRFPTHTNNDMYRVGTDFRYAAVKMSETVYIALHAVPRQFELYTT